jgi:class 3 adenylate cyclase
MLRAVETSTMPRSSTIMLESDGSRLDRATGARIPGDGFPPVQSTHGPVRTFLIADIRGYTRYTEEYGDAAAARLAARFADVVRDGVEMRGGELIQLRGDEALAVFESARQAIRAAMDLQAMFSNETNADAELPFHVGIGIDSGEAVPVDDDYRGAALNVAARLSALAHGDEVLTSAGTVRLAGRLPGLRYVDRGEARLKGIHGPTHVMRIAWEDEKEPSRWAFFFGSPASTKMGWRIGILVALIAALTAGAVVYLTGGTDKNVNPATANANSTTTETISATPLRAGEPALVALVPAAAWATCQIQAVADPGADQTAVCVQPAGSTKRMPDRWQISLYPNGKSLRAAYETIRENHDIVRGEGTCNGLSWGGEDTWEHGPGRPGGRKLCYFEGDDAVIVWLHEKLGQPDHRDVLGIARESGGDHAGLFLWWKPWHHRIGKIGG